MTTRRDVTEPQITFLPHCFSIAQDQHVDIDDEATELLYPLITKLTEMAFPTCSQGYIDSCITTAAVSFCGGFEDIDCLCGTSSLSIIGQNVFLCLLKSCNPDQGVSVANSGTAYCAPWQSTHIATSTSGNSISASTSSPISTTLASSTTGTSVYITSAATLPTTMAPTSTMTASTAPSLSPGGKAGIGVGASAVAIILLAFFLHRRGHLGHRKKSHADPNEIHPAHIVQDDSFGGHHDLMNIPLRDLNKDTINSPLHNRNANNPPAYDIPSQPVEANSISARGDHLAGKAAGTEATAFEFESQKVLLEPGLQLYRHGSAS